MGPIQVQRLGRAPEVAIAGPTGGAVAVPALDEPQGALISEGELSCVVSLRLICVAFCIRVRPASAH